MAQVSADAHFSYDANRKRPSLTRLLRSALSRVTDIGPMKMLRSIANVRFGEAAPQRRANSRMAAIGPRV